LRAGRVGEPGREGSEGAAELALAATPAGLRWFEDPVMDTLLAMALL